MISFFPFRRGSYSCLPIRRWVRAPGEQSGGLAFPFGEGGAKRRKRSSARTVPSRTDGPLERGTACGGGGPEHIVVRYGSFGVPYPPLRGYFPVATGKLLGGVRILCLPTVVTGTVPVTTRTNSAGICVYTGTGSLTHTAYREQRTGGPDCHVAGSCVACFSQ